jgi:hypothetical protein
VTILDILEFPFRGRQKRARRCRDDVTKETFIQALVLDEGSKEAASLLWDLLVDSAVIPDFRPLPDDKLLWLYGLADEDLDEDIILRIFNELKITPPSSQITEAVGEIRTPRDILRLVSISAPSPGAQ